MEVYKLLKIMKDYEKCPRCGSNMLGENQGSLIVDDNYFYRGCACGWEIAVNEDGDSIEVRC